ncbi:MAG: acetate--CoA ligase family protein [Burkholderiaceae bacterium]|nr:acetate--CoA ligase family protein [Burkholderiaceae bacterium]MBP7658775.1 acetate--CoA ligase family protein [Burkholderiaceae bacterium]
MTTPAAIDFSRLFGARSIAVIGASADEKTPSGQPLMHLRNLGYPGEVYPVNPRYEVIGQWRCYPSVSALPAAPDVALVAVAAERAPAVLEECGNKGIRFVIMITSGFAEMGEAGMAAQARLLETARRHGISMIGPNCQGMINAADGFSLGFGAPYGLRYNRGGISMTSQSGAWGNAVMILANQEGLGFRHYVSTGNEAQTTSLDLVDWYLDDPQTRLVVSYVEGFQDAHRLVSIGRKALELGKPYLLWKVGTSEAGARAAASHTANLGGEMALYRAAFEQSGIIEVTDVDDLADRAHALLTGRRPGGNRVAVISMSGGAGVLMADHCAAAGLELPTLSPDTLERLRAILPAFAGLNNPIDVTGNVSAREGSFVEALELILADPLVDMLGICLASISGPAGNQIAIDVARVCAATTKPVLVAWCADVERTREGYEALAAVGTPRYDTPVRCARGMDALWHFERARRDHERISAEPVLRLERPAQRQALAGLQADLTEYQAKQVLADYGIPVTSEALATTAEQAVVLAAQIGFPVVMKIVSPMIPHKTEAGGVKVGVRDAQAVREAFSEIVANAGCHSPGAPIDGVLVQAMVSGGTEVIVGVTQDPLFGPAILFGLGGIFAEVMKDVCFRIAPITRSEAMAMIRSIRAFPILDGARGRPKADLDALADALVRLAALAVDLQDSIAEIDINPLIVLPAGQGVVAVDALFKPKLAAGH